MTSIEATANLESALANAGITYSADFVPLSQSGRAGQFGNRSLNWRATFSNGRRTFTTLFTQGVGFIPPEVFHPGNRHSILNDEQEARICETGKWSRNAFKAAVSKTDLNPPTAANVLFCLIDDIQVLDYTNYEEWASDFGYDPDSRTGEATYRTTLANTLELRALFGDDLLRRLEDIIENAY